MSNSHELATPEAILASDELTRDEKVKVLQQLAYDAREREVACDEGMSGAPSRLGEIQRALRVLGATDETASDAKH